MEELTVEVLRAWARTALADLAGARTRIDELNVYPVPDGDTGTNLYLTWEAACDALPKGELTFTEAIQAFGRGALLGARGNSGVITSQLIRACGLRLDENLPHDRAEGVLADPGMSEAAAFADALRYAADAAYGAVAQPVEGTMLTVARAAATGAMTAANDGKALADVCLAAVASARQALTRTTDQLEVLRRAGVVDAGGAGLVVLLECLERVCAGQRARSGDDASGRRSRRRPDPAGAALEAGRAGPVDTEGIPEFEVMYLLADSDDTAVEALRARLVELGDSVLVVGGDGEWNIHAHVDDAGAAVEAGIEAGRPHRVRITRLTDAHAFADRFEQSAGARPAPRSGAAIVACAAGVGLEGLFEDAGAVVVRSGPGRRASTGGLIGAIREQHARGASGVVVLPNDGDTLLAAAAAVRAVADDGIEAHLVHVRTAVQGIAALAVFEPSAPASANVLAMQAAASATRHGAVTVANRAALTSGGPCEAGDVLGVVDGDVVIVGSDQLAVTREVVRRLLASGGELVTVVAGVDAPDGLLEAVAHEARREQHGIEVSLIDGGQAVYPVLLGVE